MRHVASIILSLYVGATSAHAAPRRTALTQQIEAAAQGFHHQHIGAALHYYKSWLAGYQTAEPRIGVQVACRQATADQLRTTVLMNADIDIRASSTPFPPLCAAALPPGVHPLASCSYESTVINLQQSSRITCERRDGWRCAIDTAHVKTACTEFNAQGEQTTGAHCATFETPLIWGRTEHPHESFHGQLVGFLTRALNSTVVSEAE